MSLDKAPDLCLQCHRMAPFCFYNNNTFSSVILLVIGGLSFPQHQIIRSLAGYIDVGIVGDEEIAAFREFTATLA